MLAAVGLEHVDVNAVDLLGGVLRARRERVHGRGGIELAALEDLLGAVLKEDRRLELLDEAVARHGAARVLAVDDLDVVERAVLLEVEVQRHRRGNDVGLGGPLELERSGTGVAVVELHAVEQRLIRATLRHLRHVRAVIGWQRGIGHGQIEVAHGELAGLGLGSIGVVDGAIVHRLDVIELRAHGPRGRGKLDLAGLLGLELEGRHGPGAAVEILLAPVLEGDVHRLLAVHKVGGHL